MSALMEDTLSSLKLHPRLCHLVRWNDFNGYGFNLHAEKGKAGQFIGKVDEGSPAEAAYLQHGDRIIEVNGVNIGNENHQQVVQRIKAGGVETKLLVVDAETDSHFKSQKIVVRGEMPEVAYCKSPDSRGFATPVMNYNQTSETQQNEETGETTSQEIAESATGTTLITNGLSEDLPAPPPELENGYEPNMEKVTVSEAEVEILSEFESDANPIYDMPDPVPVLATKELFDNDSEKLESDKQETNSLKAESEKSELDNQTNSIQALMGKAESVKSDVKSDTESGKSDIYPDSGLYKAESPNYEDAGPVKRGSSLLKGVPIEDFGTPPSLPETIERAKDIDVNDPLNYVNVSVEEMRQRILSNKKTNRFKDMNLKEKHALLDKL